MALKLKTVQEHVTAREAAGFRHLNPLQEVCTTPVGFAMRMQDIVTAHAAAGLPHRALLLDSCMTLAGVASEGAP